MSDLLRVYLDPAEIGPEGYPRWWDSESFWPGTGETLPAIKDLIREQAGHRCVRCGHPYRKGENGNGEWSPCDEHCTHGGPIRVREIYRGDGEWTVIEDTRGNPSGDLFDYDQDQRRVQRWEHEAAWRILTVHHLNGVKHDCRWWNLAALCQRCHLSVQTRVVMEREYDRPHSDWFKPYVCGFYAWSYLGEEISREEAAEREDELLALALRQDRLFT